MKKKGLLVITALSATGLFCFGGISTKFIPVFASNYSKFVITSNLDLNDLEDDKIRSYYSSLNSLSDDEARGTNLLKNLKPILKKGQQYFSYGKSATKDIWQAYEIVDRDWELSPASEISGYDPTTNTISFYKYGTSTSNPGTDPYIHALYVNRDKANGSRAWSDHNQTNYGINQEHVWPKALGFDDDNYAVGARGDLMHLWAGNGRVNGQYHSNYYYGYVDKTKSYSNAGNDYAYLDGNLKGTSKTLGGSTTVFEPQDSDKGDIARAIFYMAARYNNLSGSDSDGIDSGNPNLEIVNNVTSWQKNGYSSTTTTTGKMGIISDLLEWNRIDPPDRWEIHRNNLVYRNYTNNRNPFIDFPQWADIIWGGEEGRATPSSDGINGVDSQLINVNSLSLKINGTGTIKAVTADNSNISWTITSGDSIISIDKTVTASDEELTVTGLDAGKATIKATATVNEVEVQDECEVIVDLPIAIEEEKLNITIKRNETNKVSATTDEGTVVTWSIEQTEEVISIDKTETQSGEEVTITALKPGKAKLTAKTMVNGKQYSLSSSITIEEEDRRFILPPWMIIAAVAVAVGLLLIIILFAKFGSKKAKKKVAKTVVKTVKKSTKSTSKKKK